MNTRMSVDRTDPAYDADERTQLLGYLEYHRATLLWKVDGLDAEQLAAQHPPSTMTLGGMLKHLALVEDNWFSVFLHGNEYDAAWADVDWDSEPDWDWHSAADDTGAQLRSLWTECVQRSRDAVAEELARGVEALGETHSAWGGRGRVSLRWVLVHMIEEYARHNGHADLLRESIDGETGE
jgi:uncharacterized damage-inducible protein DinB